MSISNGYGENDCRLCGKASNFSETHNIFEKTEEGVQFVQLIKDFLPILIYRTDPLSKRICEFCCSNLKNFCEFKKKCLAYFNEQKGKLESKVDINENEKLFLNTISNSTCSTRKNGLTDSQHFDDSDNQQSESELCAELQNAIKESLTQIQMEEKRQQQAVCSIKVATNLTNYNENLVNGSLEDESSQDSLYQTKPNSTNSESHSDMELCDSPTADTSLVHNKHLLDEKNGLTEPAIKRRKLIGPKSCMERLRKKYGYSPVNEIEIEVDPVIYNPLSLLNCVLNYYNKTNIPDYECENYTKCTLSSLQEWEVFDDFDKESTCQYCNMPFKNLKLLAEHKLQHLYVIEKEKVDSPNFTISNTFHKRVRNLWLKNVNKIEGESEEEPDIAGFENDEDENVRDDLIRNGDLNEGKPIEEVIDEDEQNLLVPIEKSSDGSTKGEVVLIDTIAMVNGTPLSEIPKDLRRTMFKSVTVNGVKRKFCPLCRYTFKDNWAIESHYFSSGCHYTCRFCGLRFNKQRAEFDDHIKNHILNGDKRTDKIFASRKAHLPPKVINQSRLKARPPYVPSKPIPKITSHKIKAMFKEVEQESPKPRKETNSNVVQSDKSPAVDPYKPQNQAYFCRKCYQVFFKLDEFNVHVVSCNGTGMATVTEANNARYYNRNSSHTSQRFSSTEGSKSDTESYSPSGRPIRHCVKEAGPYVEGHEVDESMRPKTAVMNNTLPTERGYECSLCSSCFPTKYSRNSHMRIHKNDYGLKKLSDHSITISRNRQENVAKKVINMVEQNNIPTYTKYVNNVRIKQEPTEPIVEIYEGEAENMNIPSSIGSVSITPIPNANQKTNVDPDIIRLVQSNPNITIKTMSKSNNSGNNLNEQYYMQGGSGFIRNVAPMGNSPPNNSSSLDNDGRCYRCSSCSKPFANKSNLYFHKKHQCTGSKYPCPFCRKRFGTEAAYSSHIFYNHPE